MCSSAENNTFPTYQLLQQQYSGARRLLWQGGGPASEDIPDHILSEQARFRGDGGTILTYKGQSIPQPGSPDWDLIFATEIQLRFMRFNEGQAAQGHTTIYGYEDMWFQNLLKCTSNPEEQVCDYCGMSCDDTTWQSSGYSLLNGTELVIDNLIWMTHNVYISQTTILPYSFCTQYDWWICARRLPTNFDSIG
ncbi:hypothetical protein GUITHDRAFT_150745 [Guillardia theta CCMP2712]|uniref:Uncharacterized protein n=2 Tax=Guillardia theta TaxID=55529 RepID=L1JUR9_GUITC|nr:hypothetical protein GUITHDRAFT_150745 [Guillardia theta CCMP2712]EKX52291.1 hypothetical protein GUITHDRAFT_150745 [Guillardia theta CCMP2712]|eukprot:XP_005839271.1 hypothetical protein GUITHDRAFT_150745 [Guillardia theta CCMP2712]